LAGGFGIQDVVGANGLRIRVGQQGEIDLPAVRKRFQDFRRVVADGGQLDSLLLELGFGALQLDQLRFAVGSPVGRTEKEQHGAIGASERIEGLLFAELIGSRKRRRFLPDGEADARERLDGGDVNCVAGERAFDGDHVSQMPCCLILRVETEDEPRGVCIQRELSAERRLFGAFGGFREGVVHRAIAVDDYAGPRIGVGHIFLLGRGGAGGGQEYQRAQRCKFRSRRRGHDLVSPKLINIRSRRVNCTSERERNGVQTKCQGSLLGLDLLLRLRFQGFVADDFVTLNQRGDANLAVGSFRALFDPHDLADGADEDLGTAGHFGG
jgi:hypothetical protein